MGIGLRNLLIFGIVIFSVLALSTYSITPAFANISTGTDDPTKPAVLPQQVPNIPVDCVVDAGLDVVAMDVSKGAGWGGMQTAADDLVLNGFTVRTTNLEIGDVPSCVVKLIINNLIELADCVPMSPYSPTAINRVVNFVNGGGALFINHENAGCDNIVDPISAAFGITDNSITGSPNQNILLQGINFLIGNPPTLWNGVNGWVIIGWTSFVPSAESVATLGTFPNGDGVMELRQPGSGCVLGSPDSNWLADDFIFNNNNQQVALNAFLFLNECISPVPIGGTMIPIDTTALLLAGAQMNAAWMIPVIAAGIVIGVFVIKRRK